MRRWNCLKEVKYTNNKFSIQITNLVYSSKKKLGEG